MNTNDIKPGSYIVRITEKFYGDQKDAKTYARKYCGELLTDGTRAEAIRMNKASAEAVVEEFQGKPVVFSHNAYFIEFDIVRG